MATPFPVTVVTTYVGVVTLVKRIVVGGRVTPTDGADSTAPDTDVT